MRKSKKPAEVGGGGGSISNTAIWLSCQPTHFYRSLCVIWICATRDRMAGVPSTTSPENINRSSAHPTAVLCRRLAVISSFRRECHKMCRTWSVLQLPADYISCISILKGSLLEHRDNDWVLKIISPLIIEERHWDLGKEMSINTRKPLLCK